MTQSGHDLRNENCSSKRLVIDLAFELTRLLSKLFPLSA